MSSHIRRIEQVDDEWKVECDCGWSMTHKDIDVIDAKYENHSPDYDSEISLSMLIDEAVVNVRNIDLHMPNEQ